MKYLYLFLVLLFSLNIFSQTSKESKKIVSNYNMEKLNKLHDFYLDKYFNERQIANVYARTHNIPTTYSSNGSFYEIQRIVDGKPLYYKTFNISAARSSRASFLHNGGGMGLDIEGQGMYAFVWDGGHALINHQEFSDNGVTKIVEADNTNITDIDGLNHATHVMGTIIAKGQNSLAKGMAPLASGYALDWNNDIAEVISGAGIGMLVSNHSYGPNFGSLSAWSIGAYGSESKAWDNVMYNAPYYLMICAAGNDGQDFFSNSQPLDGNAQYDKLYGQTTAKNTMVVANGNDATVSFSGNITGGGTIVPSSSQGPTDDYRIKPDITGNGYELTSSIHTSIISYASYTGTSMASPNVCGSLLLLQQLYNQQNSSFMLAATLKGLALHTTDDFGAQGPDARYGWGYMNTKKAAELILDPIQIISEHSLLNNASYSFTVTVDGSKPLIASISWTDKPPVLVNTGVVNDHTPVLVNDLDIRITKDGTTFLPWKLTSVSSNTKGDNIVDPYERIDIPNPSSGTYTITVSHKGSLDGNSQNYSLIVSGITGHNASIASSESLKFNIFPNPTTTGIINISFPNGFLVGNTFVISDVLGKEVLSGSFNKKYIIQTLNLSDLKTGIYYITVSGLNSKITKTLLIN